MPMYRVPEVLATIYVQYERSFMKSSSRRLPFNDLGVLRLARGAGSLRMTNQKVSVPQRLSRLQRELDALLRLLLAAERFEPFALQVKQILFTHRSPRRDRAAADDLRDFVP